tara:strand:- start:811 stop:966 length:156 start_codon:yes stop_codon:yes gene_type:complete
MKTVYPEKPAKDFNEWHRHISNQLLTPEEKFEAEFMRIWLEFKNSVAKSRE